MEVVQGHVRHGPNGVAGLYDVRTENVHYAISLSPAYIGKSFEELRLEDYELGRAEGRWWVGGTLQISRVRVCATCQRSLDKLNFSRTQWNKKQVGVSRCRECVFSDLEPDLADALASFRAVD